jgi:predicted outer membrane repeat protein
MKQKQLSISSASRFKRVMLAAALAVVCASPAHVTHAEPDAPAISATVQPPCNTAAFDAAWNLIPIGLGGTLTFNCGAAPVSINMSGTKTITKQVTIDGGGKILLNGNFITRHFVVNAGAELTLKNITIAGGGGGFYLDAGGAVQYFGTLTVLTSTFHTNQTGDNYGGGAIYTRGDLRVENSTFRNNAAGYGGAIFTDWVSGSKGDTTLINTQILTNGALIGGGLYNIGELQMYGVTIQGNRARNTFRSDGGGIYNTGEVDFDGGIVTLNEAYPSGGGIDNRGDMSLRNVLIEKNLADYGAGVHAYARGLPVGSCSTTITSSTLRENEASIWGGGLMSTDCALAVNNSTIIANTARRGGGLVLDESTNTTAVRNSTIAMNRASEFGGGIYNRSKSLLTNITFMQNQTPGGSGGGLFSTSDVTMNNTILADSPAGGNCAGPGVLRATYSLSSDNTCVLSGAGNKLNTDPMLNPLGSYGGPTLTYLPKAGSPAIDGVIGSNAPATDQRGLPRPVGAGYDIGAVERQPSDDTPPPPPPPPSNSIVPRIRIPIVLR